MLCGARCRSLVDPLSIGSARSEPLRLPDPRSVADARPLRLLPDLHPVAPRRLVREPQAGLPAVPRGWSEPSAQAPRRHVSAAGRERQPGASAPNQMWSMDFVSDALFDGRRLRALTVVDAYTREALTIEVDQGIKGEQVVEAITRIALLRGAPKAIRVDNGPEFVSKALDRWAYENAVTLDFKPAGQTDRQCVRGVAQRAPARRVPEHALVPVADRRQDQDRGLASRLQREPSSHIAWLDDAKRIRCCSGHQGRRMNAGISPSGWRKNRGTLNQPDSSKAAIVRPPSPD